MHGFEVIVRPVVFPNIRPAPAQSLPPADDPDKGFAVIRGNGGKHIDLTNSHSASTSSGGGSEVRRRVDKARVYQMDERQKINKANFVDIEAVNKLWLKTPPDPQVQNNPSFQPVGPPGYQSPGYQSPGYSVPGYTVTGYVLVPGLHPVPPNVKLLNRNIIKVPPQQGTGE